MRSNIVFNPNATALSDVNLQHWQQHGTLSVVIDQANSQCVPIMEDQRVSPNAGGWAGSRIVNVERNSGVGEYKVEFLMKIIKSQNDELMKRIDGIENKFNLKFRQLIERND